MGERVKLPVWVTVAEAYRALWRHRSFLLRSAWVPLLLFLAADYGAFHLRSLAQSYPEFPSQAVDGFWSWDWYGSATRILIYGTVALFLAPCLRVFLLGRPDGSRPWPLPFSRSALGLLGFLWPNPFTRAALTIFGLVAVYMVVQPALFLILTKPLFTLLDSAIPLGYPEPVIRRLFLTVANVFAPLVLLYLLARLGFAAVLAAVDLDWSPRSVWSLTSGHAPRLMLALLIGQVPVMLIKEAALVSFALFAHDIFYQVSTPLAGLFWIISAAVWAAVSATAFAAITGHPAQGLRAPEMSAPEPA